MDAKKLNHYTILDRLGVGGMGEVYRAEDTKLGRQVAIKVLPEDFAGEKERMARFEREAQTLAALNHPNIAAIHGLEEDAGKNFLVMELVEGETLDQKLAKGALPIEEALETCRQIAEAIEAAHEKGIIHRDLKPANVKITPEARVKVLDFGLAKALIEDREGPVLVDSPTLTAQMTQPGIILGTAPYMSPEQAKGKAVDKRTDIWAFGCILYECLTGKMAFQGDSVSEVMAAILKEEPDWGSLPSNLLPSIRLLLKRCLNKDPRRRLQSAGDARIELTEDGDRIDLTAESVAAQKPLLRPSWWVAILACVAALAGWFLFLFTGGSADRQTTMSEVTKFIIELPKEQHVFNKTDRPVIDISNDGRRLAWIGDGKESHVLYTRTLDDQNVIELDGTRGLDADLLAISPDNRWIGFKKDGVLMKISVDGGTPVPLADADKIGSGIVGFDWGEGDRIVVAASNVLYLFDLNNESRVQLTELNTEKGEIFHYNPRFILGGRAVIFASCIDNWNTYELEVVSLDSRERKFLVNDAYTGFVTTNGRFVFGLRDGNIFCAPFDTQKLEITGPESLVLSSVQMQLMGRVPQFALSPNGSMAYIPAGQGILLQSLVWIGRDGTREPLNEPPDRYFRPQLSPDGTQMVLEKAKGHYGELNFYPFDRRVFTPFTAVEDTFRGIWNHDGSRLIFASSSSGAVNLFMTQIKPIGSVEQLTHSAHQQFPCSWSKDGRFVAYTEWSDPGQYDIWLLPVEGQSREPVPFLTTDANESQPSFSPDGRWIAYAAEESEKKYEIFLQEILSDGQKSGKFYKVSRAGGLEPRWSLDGFELFFRSFDGSHLMGVSLDPESFEPGPERVVLENVHFPTSDTYAEFGFYDVADNQKFIVLLEESGPEFAEMVVVVNWLEELKRKVEEGK